MRFLSCAGRRAAELNQEVGTADGSTISGSRGSESWRRLARVSKVDETSETELAPQGFGRWIGIVLQGLILGVLLFGATLALLVMQSSARVFRYENF